MDYGFCLDSNTTLQLWEKNQNEDILNLTCSEFSIKR